MIAIKGMDMPKNLQECRFKMVSHKSICCLIDGSVRELNGKTQMKFLPICSNCTMFPYESLPEENKDMSWEELKTTYKNKIDTFYLAGGIERITINGKCLKNFKFYSDGTIADEHFNIISEKNEISTICKVIKALIGDER